MSQKKPERPALYTSNDSTARVLHDGRSFYSVYVDRLSENFIDFWTTDRLYGRVTPDMKSILPRTDHLRQIKYTTSNRTLFLLDFVADAWEDLVLEMRDYTNRGRVVMDSPWANLLATKGYSDVNVEYDKHLKDIIFPSISDGYLSIKEKNHQAADFKGFLKAISPLLRLVARDVPITRSGFIQSKYCPVNCSGLVVELGDEMYSEDFPKLEKYINDNNFSFFAEIAKKNGFMIDKNAPWRLVANIASPAMKKRIAKYEDPNSFFLERVYYHYSYREDISNLKVYLFDMYETYRSANPYVFGYNNEGGCSTALERKKANYVDQFGDQNRSGVFGDRWHLKTYYLLRQLEAGEQFSSQGRVADLRLIYDILDTHGFYDALYYLHTHILGAEKHSNIK